MENLEKDWRVPLLPGDSLNPGYNWPMIRFSDVLLMFAEAENELNGSPSAAQLQLLKKCVKSVYE
ncbi:MAG: RagB/SusD family nutrient uptake outer membrane protein [Emticicia sp.]|nr:RagB/SusD family nutrient uptake outer membrane protein [Emticicia sp.]